MKYSQLKTIKTFTENLESTPDFREVAENIENKNSDFEINNVRFILDSVILSVLADDLESDPYLLGCFNSDFIASVTNWPDVLIQAAQEGESFEELGRAIVDNCDMAEFAKCYSDADGFGHHFNSYDGGEEVLMVNGLTYHVFDQH